MKKYLVFMLLLLTISSCFAQIKWSEDTISPSGRQWDNYSTSFIEPSGNNAAFIVTAIPYNGMNSNFNDMNTPLDMSFKGSLYRFRSTLSDHSRKLYTYDSSSVYFLVPNISKSDAAGYEYRIVLNATTIINGWSRINQYTDFQLNAFKKGCAFLGGYKASWGSYIIAEIRKINDTLDASSAIVYWQEIKPAIQGLFTTGNLNDFFTIIKRPWDKNIKPVVLPAGIPEFPSSEKIIIVYLNADIFKKEAIEYQLTKDNKVVRIWNANDYDNNFIWLKDLSPGKYQLDIRYRAQRQNTTTFKFDISPQWQETAIFKITASSLLAAFIGFIALLFLSSRQKKRLKKAVENKERTAMNLQILRSQLNPHFIFNALGSIQSMVNKEQTDLANTYLSTFSDLLRQSLEYNSEKLIPLKADIQMLNNYIKLEQLRFQFSYNLVVDETLEHYSISVPAMLLQPMVENAVKHGICGLQEKGLLDLRYLLVDKDLVITISDNGKGFDINRNYSGYGIRLTAERIAFYNNYIHPGYIDLKTESSISGGTTVILTFKTQL